MATMTIEQGLVVKLGGTAGVTALVSTRIYPARLPQGATLPAIVYQRVSTPRLATHDTSGSGGTAHPRFQIEAWATTYLAAKAITDAVRAALNGFRGTITSGSDSVSVQGALVEDEITNYEPEAELYRSRSEYHIWHVE